MSTRVLLVDDEKEWVSHVAERLTLRGMEVCTAYDGSSALDLVRSSRPDVVVLDLFMPGLNGVETMAELKKLRADLPVIMITGYGDLEKAKEGVQAGAAVYLIKPVGIETLIEAIEEAVPGVSSGSAAVAP